MLNRRRNEANQRKNDARIAAERRLNNSFRARKMSDLSTSEYEPSADAVSRRLDSLETSISQLVSLNESVLKLLQQQSEANSFSAKSSDVEQRLATELGEIKSLLLSP